MSFATPEYSRAQVNRAGRVLAAPTPSQGELDWATEVLANWRACHLYPINTFQATLRGRVQRVDKDAIVAQRLKRAPSVIAKLRRFPTMNLAQMQDIGGLRAVLSSVSRVRKIEKMYRDPYAFKHILVSSKDYILEPKPDGYRGIHLVFRYNNEYRTEFDGLHLELQLRTQLQHAWATAVETMGTFLGQALKSGKGETQWQRFFAASSAALTHFEKCPPVPGFQDLTPHETFSAVREAESRLGVLNKLQGFAIAASQITTGAGSAFKYHLVVLDAATKSVMITPFSEARLEQANAAYANCEKRSLEGEQIEAVLVSAGPIDALKKAYPNYFLDTHQFVTQINKIIAMVERPTMPRGRK